MYLFEQIEQGKNFPDAYVPLPALIEKNINPEFVLRPYQIDAFRNFVTYFENESFRRYPSQTLFHMATGSGKTMMMAGLIIYLYKKGYRNFLFFVHLDNIVIKTKENFLNPTSAKYLFKEEINIDGEIIKIKEVENFQGSDKESINICFTTIQGLHSDMWNAKENSLTFEDFRDEKIVLISDEAHHLNVDTKKQKTKEQDENERSWEYTANIIFGANRDNVMLEFTATCDLDNPVIRKEYENKIIFNYPLSKFRMDLYSKEVKTMRSDIPLMQRAIQAVLLNQYRLKVFQDHGLDIKPVVLFKALTKEQSKTFMNAFLEVISNLTIRYLQDLRGTTDNPTLLKMYNYFEENNITYEVLVQELKEEFSNERCISMNDSNEAENVQLIVNSLEDKNNPYRAIFQVKKLDEGWDVLNLFDIVRLYETRDGKNGKPGKATVAEAQLIGRGARYCPFLVDKTQEKYKRKYDNDLDNPMRICEELYYHCQNDSKFISELTIALKELGIMANNIVERQYTFKEDFKNNDLYKNGLVFYNNKIEKSRNDVFAIPQHIRDKEYSVFIYTGKTTIDTLFEDSHVEGEVKTYTKRISISEIAKLNYSLVNKALRKYEVFKFNTLKNYFPHLNSTHEFIHSTKYLGDIKLAIQSKVQEPDMIIYYNSCVQTFAKIAESISSIEITYEGTKIFESKKFYEVFKDNQKVNYTDPQGNGAGVPQSASEISAPLRLDLSKEDWYVFNDNYGTSEEKAFVAHFKTYIDSLQEKYDKVFLVRNERKLKIFSFLDGNRFEPDYLLFLQRNTSDGYDQMQIFIEPKGSHLLTDDNWKQELLLSLEKDAIPVTKFTDDNNYKIWGFHFFNQEQRIKEFTEDMNRL
ncbi:methylase [Paenibacillus sp. IHB B 3415]|uniref:DEAD/DEAH box helicase family protein n=1 Tax=Paenibacillus sp. IHB B 3415 TaxID=867080 RepID=UPI0005744010|nr:DEAD/DEAH box helicase family protein [Paenibacillus sp. IHB B 3415]KHL91638.1 methylase [Paenibacillus sp. IHB B 3415]